MNVVKQILTLKFKVNVNLIVKMILLMKDVVKMKHIDQKHKINNYVVKIVHNYIKLIVNVLF